MGGFSLFHAIVVFALVLLLLGGSVRLFRGGRNRSVLVLRRFHVYCQPQPAEMPMVQITGRRPGIIGFILSVMQLDVQTTFTVTALAVECQRASLRGITKKIVPLSRVAATEAGVIKPVEYLIFACVSIFGGIVAAGLVGASIPVGSSALAPGLCLSVFVFIAAVLVVAYFLSKRILLEITSNAGVEISLQFKPSVIEGVPVDVEKALAAAEIIRDLVLGRCPTTPHMPPIPDTATTPAARPPEIAGTHDAAAASRGPSAFKRASPLTTPSSDKDRTSDEQSAQEALRRAVEYYKSGQGKAAVAALDQVVEAYPSTRAAKTARDYLRNLQAR